MIIRAGHNTAVNTDHVCEYAIKLINEKQPQQGIQLVASLANGEASTLYRGKPEECEKHLDGIVDAITEGKKVYCISR